MPNFELDILSKLYNTCEMKVNSSVQLEDRFTPVQTMKEYEKNGLCF